MMLALLTLALRGDKGLVDVGDRRRTVRGLVEQPHDLGPRRQPAVQLELARPLLVLFRARRCGRRIAARSVVCAPSTAVPLPAHR